MNDMLTCNLSTEEPLPKYSDKGNVLFYYLPIPGERPDVEILDYDPNHAYPLPTHKR